MTAPPMRRLATSSLRLTRKLRDRQILVVDDHVTFAEALASVLNAEPGLHAFAATTIEDAQRAFAEYEVDVVLLQVDLDGDDGIRFAREVLSEDPDVRIVAVTASDDESHGVDAVRIGVSGWVPKNEPFEQLLSVVHGALRGETWIPPRLLTRVLAELSSAQRGGAGNDQALATLTIREKEVLNRLMSGMKTNDIARNLYLSRNTVRTHVQNILRKLHVHSTLAAVALARRAG